MKIVTKNHKMKLLRLILMILIAKVATATVGIGQLSGLNINYSGSAKLTVNEIPLDGKTKIEDLITKIGQPSQKKDYQYGETSYVYDEIGVVFSIKSGLVKGLAINFNWDGDKKFPEKSFIGTLKIGERAITKETDNKSLLTIKSIEFLCPISIMCVSKDKNAPINCVAGFNEDKLTQIGFIIK